MGQHFYTKHAAKTHLGNRGFAPGPDDQWNKYDADGDQMLWAQVTVRADGTVLVFYWTEGE